MPWFKVDDRWWSHPKVLQLSDAAQALWLRAGSWSMSHLTDGLIPRHAVQLLRGSPKPIRELVEVGLWVEVADGWMFHGWHEYQPTRDEVEERRRKRSEAGRLGGLKSGASRRQATVEAPAEANASRMLETRSNTHPIPSHPKDGGSLSLEGDVSRRAREADSLEGDVVSAFVEVGVADPDGVLEALRGAVPDLVADEGPVVVASLVEGRGVRDVDGYVRAAVARAPDSVRREVGILRRRAAGIWEALDSVTEAV